jgi:hypothetical protein
MTGIRDRAARFLVMPGICSLASGLGAVAQLGERLLCKQEVTGSIPVGSTRSRHRGSGIRYQSFRGMRIERLLGLNGRGCAWLDPSYGLRAV